jgi:hypothetical protein
MCRHLSSHSSLSAGRTQQESKRAVGDLLTDIENGLDLARKLILLADDSWKECDCRYQLPVHTILRDCAGRIVTEAMRSRMVLEARGKVHFGSAMLEESPDPVGQDPDASPRWDSAPCVAAPLQSQAIRPVLGISSTPGPGRQEQSPLGALRRLCASFLATTVPGDPDPSAIKPREGGA